MTTISVEADVYSGLQNPVWDLEPAEAVRFLALVAQLGSLDHAPAPAPITAGLGYRRLKITMTTERGVQRIVVANGHVFFHPLHDEPPRQRSDDGRAFERWVLRTGKEALGEEMLNALLS
ncbi:MAG: hypothetical protein HY299_20335 [Verrucomicrobia bacterium]|nr:hypothetical protein [Verrucomicrobiota bacterium]